MHTVGQDMVVVENVIQLRYYICETLTHFQDPNF